MGQIASGEDPENLLGYMTLIDAAAGEPETDLVLSAAAATLAKDVRNGNTGDLDRVVNDLIGRCTQLHISTQPRR